MVLLDSLITQVQVIWALLIRETRTRFGTNRLGYLWAFVEPLVTITIFFAAYFLTGTTSMGQMGLFPYLATGIIPYFFFSSVSGRISVAITSNTNLLYYPHVTTVDVIISRYLLELATYLVIFAAFLGGYGLATDELTMDSMLATLSGIVLAGVLGMGWGTLECAARTISDSAEMFFGFLGRPLFWVSGLFFTANDLTSDIRDVLLYNPLLHVTEIVRDGWFNQYTAFYVDLSYVLKWCLGMLVVGFSLERLTRRRIQVT